MLMNALLPDQSGGVRRPLSPQKCNTASSDAPPWSGPGPPRGRYFVVVVVVGFYLICVLFSVE